MDRIVDTSSIKDAENCRSFVVFDTETTGLYPWRYKIIEIGAVRFRDGEPVETFHSMIDPEIHIPEMITFFTQSITICVMNLPRIMIRQMFLFLL